MKLDRARQLEMLQALADVYPRYTVDLGNGKPNKEDLENLWYLKEQNLIEGALEMSIEQSFIFQGVRITAKGVDFLADDGGVSAILGTVTVKLHADTIKELMLARVENSSVSSEKKSWLKKQLEIASSETIKKIVGAVLDEGFKHAPDLIRLVEQAARSAA
ncbi:hypothetical protein [Pulveribacter sp.]|uniref:hypothetical protein n=1 Tax=Pulveribacter sp. TaxID=2678893 RepID=UPI0028A8E51E|nr:hypothetical protein [Pulveribacter sp.]